MRITERFRRADFGHLDIDMTFDDPKMYTKPFTIKVPHDLLADSDIFEMFCNENEKDRVQPTKTVGERSVRNVRPASRSVASIRVKAEFGFHWIPVQDRNRSSMANRPACLSSSELHLILGGVQVLGADMNSYR